MTRQPSLEILHGGPYARPVLPFDPHFRDPNDALLRRLRRSYRLREIAGEGSDYQRARRLKTWVRRQWNHGFDQLPSPYSALDLLSAARKGKQFQCGHYSQTFVECCLALGIPARVIGLARVEAAFPYNFRGNCGHIVAEAYCRELGRWILFDCDANCTFVDPKRRPLGAIDLHEAWHTSRGRNVRMVQDRPRFQPPPASEVISADEVRKIIVDFFRQNTLQFYHYIRTGTVQGYQGSPGHGYIAHCVHYAQFVQHPPALCFAQNDGEQGSGGFLTAQRDHWEWPVNRTYARLTMLGRTPSRRVRLDLAHTLPFFDHYQVRLNGDRPISTRRDQVNLTLRNGTNQVIVTAVDQTNRPGAAASLRIRVRDMT